MKSSSYLEARYGFDRTLATLAMVLFSPLFAIITIVIVFSSGRPVLYRQERVGRDGSTFSILKFRTMINDAEKIGGGYMAESMNLITPFGRLLRKSSLDELPQLLNIARGEMVLIGPRPALRDQYDRYSDQQRRRVEVRPGITGLAQVKYRNEAPWSKRIELDVQYIDRAGPLLDAKILALTCVKVFCGGGIQGDQRIEDVDDLGNGEETNK